MHHLTNRLQIIAALALREEGEGAKHILEYASREDEKEMQKMLQQYDGLKGENLKVKLEQQIKALQAQESFSGIAEIHPAWLVEALQKESPRVIGVILRHLPSKHVRYLLDHLPKRIVAHIPKMMEAFYVPNEILNIIRRRFERHFVPMRISHQITSFHFEHIYYLHIEELNVLFRELGLSELALALVHSPGKIAKMILNRFGIGDAKAIVSRIKKYREEPKGLLKEARYLILESEGRELGAERFLTELGLGALSKAFEPSMKPVFERLKQKLAPVEAEILKRHLNEQWVRFEGLGVSKRQEWVVEHVRRLNEAGKINPMWSPGLKEKAA